MKKILLLLILFSFFSTLQAGTAEVQGVRVWSAPDHTRLVFDVDGPIDHKLFTLEKPDRIVIDFKQARLTGELAKPIDEDHYVKNLRHAPRNDNDFRVVLDLKNDVKPKSFVLKPNQQYGYRLVVDLEGVEQAAVADQKPRIAKSVKDQKTLREVVVAIDAGHGGEDPGASGPRGTKEKEVVYAIAKKLAALLEKEPGFKPVLTRRGDYYIGLRNRMKIARKHKADLFVSIHADAFRDPRVRGASVYVLSSRGASNEASRWLADRENAADLVGGVKLEDKDDVLASVLLDLSQTATRQASMEVASSVYRQLKANGKIHGRKVLKAGFVVLKSPDVPSLLVETAFISNPDEERNLKNHAHQLKMAKAIRNGIRDYFHESPPPGTWLAKQLPKQHVIARGDTLSGIAEQYRVSLATLRRTNRIKGDHLRVGQVLTIPRS
ncbi:MAG: N-acetylmuramoyl-L-alanine amidase [Chromatiales bacterium]|jgi:N-acetylmuramoyl-L-alanine amidase